MNLVKRRSKKDTLYRLSPITDGWTVYKMDEDYDVLQTYTISPLPSRGGEQNFICSCPARVYPCKHVKILKRMFANNTSFYMLYSLNKDEFYAPLGSSDHDC